MIQTIYFVIESYESYKNHVSSDQQARKVITNTYFAIWKELK